MAMNRAGLKSLMGYQEGGDPSSPTTGTSLSGLGAFAPKKFDFDKSFQEYSEMLEPMARTTRPVSGFEAISAIGAGLLGQPTQEKIPNIGRGIGLGFQALTNQIRARNDQIAKENASIGLKATELALTDKAQADKFLQDYALKLIDLANKDIKLTTLRYKDENGEDVEKSFVANDPKIGELVADGAVEVRTPQSLVNVNTGNLSDLEKERSKNIAETEQLWSVEAQAAVGVKDQIDYARGVADRLGEEGFGPTQAFALPFKSIFNDLGFKVNLPKLGDQQLMGSIGTSFAMALVGQTKGAISNKEMDLFLEASPTLGSTYIGFNKMLDYLERIADRSLKFNDEWNQISIQLAKENATIPEIQGALARFQTEFRAKNKLFNDEEKAELEQAENKDAYRTIKNQHDDYAKQRKQDSLEDNMPQEALDLIEEIRNSNIDPTIKLQQIEQIREIYKD